MDRPPRYVYGAVCAEHQLHTEPYGHEHTAVGALTLLHADPDRGLPVCRSSWEIVRVNLTPPVSEHRYPAMSI
jgi:hypothetical protein